MTADAGSTLMKLLAELTWFGRIASMVCVIICACNREGRVYDGFRDDKQFPVRAKSLDLILALASIERHMATTSPQDSIAGRVSWPRICALIIGYLVVLAGCCFFFSFRMLYLLTIGSIIIVLASHGIPQPPVSWRSTLVAAAGCLVITGVLALFGQDRIQNWRPHPAGYIPAWFLCVYAFRQLREIVCHHKSDEKGAA